MRSPMITNGRSKPMTTSRVAELTTVSVMTRLAPVAGWMVGNWRSGCHGVRPASTPDSVITSATVSSCRYAITCTPATPLIARISRIRSMHTRRPSRAWSCAPATRRMISSGMWTPGTCVRIHSAAFAERSGPTPTRMNARSSKPSSSDSRHERLEPRHVVAVLRLDELRARGDLLREPVRPPVERRRERILGRAEEHARRERDLAAALEAVLVAQRPADVEQRDAVEIEHGLGLRMIAVGDTVAGEAQHVAHAHRRAAEDVALDRDPVAVAARDLHHGRIADARQQRAHGEARHVAVGAAAVRRVDRVDVAVEHASAAIDVFRIRGIRGVELGRYRERSGAQQALEAARRRVSRQDGQRIARHGLVFELHRAPARP